MKLDGGWGMGPTSAVSRHELSSEYGELGLVQLRPLLEASGQALIVLDDDDTIAFASSAAIGLLATRADAFEQQSVHGTAPALRGGAAFREHALIAGPDLPLLVQACDGVQHVALEAGEGRRFLARLTLLRDRRGAATHVCLTLEAPRATPPQAPALEAVGRLAAELGHEINNQLAAALNYASIVQRRAGASMIEPEHLEELQQALWRASGWAASLRLVGRQRGATSERLRSDQVLAEIEPLLRHVTGEVALHFDLDAARTYVQAPRAYFEQVVIGVLAHALGRMSAPKAITLRTRVVNASETRGPIVRVSCHTHGDNGISHTMSAQRSAARPRGTLHRALKRCHAKLHHDAHHIWVDFAARD